MQRKKKVKGLVIGVTLLSLITAGCGAGNDNSSNKEQASPNNTAVVTNKEQPMEITIANDFNPPEADNNYVQKQLEEKFNVKIKNVKLERGSWK